MLSNNSLKKIIEYLDYCYLTNNIKNTLNSDNKNNNDLNIWNIFSFNSINNKNDFEKHNILYLVQNIITKEYFNNEIFLLSIYIYKKICVKYANIIDNYIYLFGSIYVSINLINNKNVTENFLISLFNIEISIVKKMIDCINIFLNNNYIYFNIRQRNKIIQLIS